MDANQMGGLIAGGAVLALTVFSFVYGIFQIIANWKIFKKAGEKGWKSLIPVYNLIVQYKLTWKSVFAIPVLLLLSFGSYAMSSPDVSQGVSIAGSIAAIVGGILNIIGLDKLAKSFGKGRGFTLGLVLLGPIFYMILGFGKAQYIGNTTEQ